MLHKTVPFLVDYTVWQYGEIKLILILRPKYKPRYLFLCNFIIWSHDFIQIPSQSNYTEKNYTPKKSFAPLILISLYFKLQIPVESRKTIRSSSYFQGMLYVPITVVSVKYR